MPLYEFLCPVCGTKFEQLRRFAQADDPATCPQGHTGAKRLMSPVMIFAKDRYGSTLLPGTGYEPKYDSLAERLAKEKRQQQQQQAQQAAVEPSPAAETTSAPEGRTTEAS